MVMDLVTGGELFDVVADQQRLPESQARTYFQQLVDGVEYCHSRRVYHRDLKPENLLVSSDKRQLKITDFGLASIKEANAPSELLWTVMGSPHYIPPEIITSAAKGYEGEKVDVWASGMVLFGMLAGFLPFDHPETNQLYRAIVHAPIEFPSHFSNDVIKLLTAVFQKDPTNRPNMTQIKSFAWFRVDYTPALPRSPRAPEAGKKRSKKKRGERRLRDSTNRDIARPDSRGVEDALSAVDSPSASTTEEEEAPKRLESSGSRRRILGRLGGKAQRSESTSIIRDDDGRADRMPSRNVASSQSLATSSSEDVEMPLRKSSIRNESRFSNRKAILTSLADHKKSGHALALSNVLGPFRKKNNEQLTVGDKATITATDSSPVKRFYVEGEVSDVSPMRAEDLHLLSKDSEDNTSSRSMKLLANAYRKSVEGMKARGMSVKSLSMRTPKGSEDDFQTTQWDKTSHACTQPTSPISPGNAEAVSPASLFVGGRKAPQSLPSHAFMRGAFDQNEQPSVTQKFSPDETSCSRLFHDTPRALRDVAVGEESAFETIKASQSMDIQHEIKFQEIQEASSCVIFKPTKLLINHDTPKLAPAPHVLCPPRFIDDSIEWCLDSADVFADVEDDTATAVTSDHVRAPSIRQKLPARAPPPRALTTEKKPIFAPLSLTLERNLSKTVKQVPLDKSRVEL